jgi:AcrR family transcriptional regulator
VPEYEMPRVKTLTKKQAILEAAARVFAAKEFHQVLIDEVAAEAGVGKGTIYRYFDTKEDLYLDTILDVLDQLHGALVSTLPGEISPTRRLERIAREILQLAWRRRHLFTLLQADERRFLHREDEIGRRREALQRVVQQVILDGIERGEFRGIDARIGAQLFRGMIRAAACFRHEEDSTEELTSQIVAIFTRGIAKAGR